MKRSIILTMAIFAAVSLSACNHEDKKVIQFGELPQEAQTFVDTHFADKQVSIVYHDTELADKDYEVIFTDGANIDFSKKGEWTEVEDRDTNGVPTAIMLQGIVDYVSTNFAGQYVVQLGKERSNYEVELNNGVEMVFDKEGQFLRYDD
ncbi:MAG: PepSY-like domain-containing protein [Bacteroidales bacterium]|nr:PepSY-like domain-containing protein [Bacteroidales bacterium]